MIGGGWTFVIAAYAVTLGGLLVLAVSIVLRARKWAKHVHELNAKRSTPQS